MQLLHSRNPWGLRYGPDPTINFCFWVLLLDGLRVPPFDQHPDGDGSLRALGLTEASWQAWLLRVIDPQQQEHDVEQLRQQAIAEYLKVSHLPDVEHLAQQYRAEQLKLSKEPPLPLVPEFYFYHASWRGNEAIRNRLIELQDAYKQVYCHYEMLCSDLIRAWDKEERRAGIRLYDELKPYHTRIPPLTIHFVEYDSPLDYLVFPATLIMTVQEGQPNHQEWRSRVLEAAVELAARPGRRGRQSLYSRESVGQLTTAYRRHERKPTPPSLPRQEIPCLINPAKQAVLEELANRLFYGSVDFATVQFLREKKRSSWELHEVTFAETDGEQHRMIFILQQNEDGFWHFNNGGSSVDIQEEWSKLSVPVRDHPLIFLTPHAISGMPPDTHYYLLTAYGSVIDNGFHVERIHLSNDVGQVLEDTVEDGYVFFACQPGEQIQLPMQAELYDHEGKLVWQQTVTIGGGLPF